jgi:hypothetical protein
MSYKEALEKIMRICYESSEYGRRVQHIHETAMIALGLTENQRAERHIKASIRSEAYRDATKKVGRAQAKKNLTKEVEEESGEKRMKYKSIVEEIVG